MKHHYVGFAGKWLLAMSLALFLTTAGSVYAEDFHAGMQHLPNIGEPKDIEEIDISFITFSLHVSDYSWYVFDGLRERLARYGKPYNLHMSAAGGHGDHEGLLQLAQEAIIRGTDVLVVHPTQLLLNTSISELAEREQVPLIWFNVGPRGMLDLEEFPALSYVGYEHYEGGERVGAFLADFLEGESLVGILRLFTGDYADERLDGAIDVLTERRPDVEFMEEYAEGSRIKGNEIATSWLTGFPEIKTIFGGNSASAMGAAAAVETIGLDVGVIGYGCIQEEVEAILDGRLLGSILRDPWDNGHIIADIIVKWWEGREAEIEPAYATFQKLIYSPDLVMEYVDPLYWQPWVDEYGMPEITWPEEEKTDAVVLEGWHDPNHVANCTWLDKFRR